ncbi:PCI domain-containing protein [Cardiosporidium cionae]|uniref:PCI domain-containing protein n=1 Tax=Cardiosporidium cionae TaxID=476202 RepID=A0ABQ7JCW0_9APIC|nr:PCI domain-containing protein [Cardiosporidium cionae]|eukprot:KAF8821814.1 PCI domain-containing protein [Cardiosporidium cionae]
MAQLDSLSLGTAGATDGDTVMTDVVMETSDEISTLLSSSIPAEVFLASLLENEAQNAYRSVIEEISSLLFKRLYHEISQNFKHYLCISELDTSNKINFFHFVVLPLKQKVSSMQLVDLLGIAIEKAEPLQAVSYLNHLNNDFEKLEDARLIFMSIKAFHLTRLMKYKESTALLEEVKTLMDKARELDAAVNSAYHNAFAKLYLAEEKFDDFLYHALLYISFTPMGDIPEAERRMKGLEMAKAALVAPRMYNFGELLQLPLITGDLQQSENRWILEVLSAFDDGSLTAYNALLEKYHRELEAEGFSTHLVGMRRKITLLALMDYAFHKPKRQRVLSFEEIAGHCCISIDEVELLLIKAMSLQLVKGRIDQVNQNVRITWVKQRILDSSRLALMRQRINTWVLSAKELLAHMEEMTPELLIS